MKSGSETSKNAFKKETLIYLRSLQQNLSFHEVYSTTGDMELMIRVFHTDANPNEMKHFKKPISYKETPTPFSFHQVHIATLSTPFYRMDMKVNTRNSFATKAVTEFSGSMDFAQSQNAFESQKSQINDQFKMKLFPTMLKIVEEMRKRRPAEIYFQQLQRRLGSDPRNLIKRNMLIYVI